MAQVTLYLEEATARNLKAAAAASGQSVSRWVAELIRQKVATTWPENVVRLAGAWPDLATAEELRSHQPDDAPREMF